MNVATERPVWTREGAKLGARLALPLVPGYIAFGLAVGATSASKGFTLLATMAMNVFVYAAASQRVGMEIWPAKLTAGAVVSLALIVATVNARMLAIFYMAIGVGSAVGSWGAGWIYDLSGSYRVAFICSIASYAAGVIAFWALRRPPETRVIARSEATKQSPSD